MDPCKQLGIFQRYVGKKEEGLVCELSVSPELYGKIEVYPQETWLCLHSRLEQNHFSSELHRDTLER